MAVDIIARALAAGLVGPDGKILESKLPDSAGGIFGTSGVTAYAVGGIPVGTNLEGKTIAEILTMMLYGTLNPTLTEPSFSATIDDTNIVLGENVTITGTVTFNRGSISPAYGTSGYRAGAPTSYTIAGQVIETTATTEKFSVVVPQIVLGANQIEISVAYEAGEQPKNSSGENYGTPCPAGTMSKTITITGNYPVFVGDTTGTFVEQENEALFDNGVCEVSLPAETDEAIKQKVAFATDSTDPIVGIKQFDDTRQQWDWIRGTPEQSLTSFASSSVQLPVDGTEIDYTAHTNQTALIGARKVRFYTELPEEGNN